MSSTQAGRIHPGKQLGNYRLHTFLGVNKGVSTFLGQHVYLQTEVTVKLYQLLLLKNDRQNFLAEARTIARLIHPHIFRILEFGIESDTPFLITPFAQDGTLLQRYPAMSLLPLPVILLYARQMAAALDYAHSQGILHLDVRPENMWLRGENTLFLSDFRITFAAAGSRSESINAIAEAAAYMAPEQIQGKPGPASDQYALGVVVYEWICGSRPFSGANYIDIARQHLQTSPSSLRSSTPDLPLEIEQTILRALSKDPRQRFSSVQDFVDSLEQGYAAHRRASRQATVQFDSRPTQLLAHKDASSQDPKRHHTRRNIILGLTGLASAAAVGGAISWLTRSSPVHITKKSSYLPGHAKPGTTFTTYRGHSDIVYGVSWSRDGQNIASWGRDGTMQIWNTTTFAALQTLPMASVLAWSPDWNMMASGGLQGFQAWKTASGNILFMQDFSYTGAGGTLDLPVNSQIQWSPDGNSLLSTENTTQIWSISTRKILFSYPSSVGSWSSDGKRLVLQEIDYDNTNTFLKVHLFDILTENQIVGYQVKSNQVVGAPIHWSPDGKYIASGDGSVWQAMTGKSINRYQSKAKYTDLIWSPDSKYLAFYDGSNYASQSFNSLSQNKADPTVHIWSPFTGQEILVYRAHTDGVNCIAWSPDSTLIASASADNTVRVWQAIASQ